ncbi:MAG TPA: hypothetical protein VFY95_07220 [Sphingomicrobium sp.]
MNRFVAMILALLFASVSVASACTASPNDWIRFTLEPEHDGSQIKATFRDDDRSGRDESRWSAAFPPSQLIGFDVSGFRGVGTRPIRFAVVREAGRLDCTGEGGQSRAAGNCGFTPDPSFMQLLESRGIARPTREQAFSLMAVGVRRELIDALAAARYPAPTAGQLVALTAVGVTGRYITDMARAGYRPTSIDTLVQFQALGITPDFIGGFARIGYANIDPDELVQLKALDITPEFVAGFERIGYRNIPVETLVQLKALNITPEFVQSVDLRPGGAIPPVSELMQRKLFGSRR